MELGEGAMESAGDAAILFLKRKWGRQVLEHIQHER